MTFTTVDGGFILHVPGLSSRSLRLNRAPSGGWLLIEEPAPPREGASRAWPYPDRGLLPVLCAVEEWRLRDGCAADTEPAGWDDRARQPETAGSGRL